MNLTLTQLRAAIAAAQADIAKYEAAIVAGNYLKEIAVGDVVSATYGRGDKARTIEGPVVAVVGNQAAILIGLDTYKVFVKDIVSSQRDDAGTPTPDAEQSTTVTPQPTDGDAHPGSGEPVDALAGGVDAEDTPAETPEELAARQLDELQRRALTPEQYIAWKSGV